MIIRDIDILDNLAYVKNTLRLAQHIYGEMILTIN